MLRLKRYKFWKIHWITIIMCVKSIDTNISSLHIVPIMPYMFEPLLSHSHSDVFYVWEFAGLRPSSRPWSYSRAMVRNEIKAIKIKCLRGIQYMYFFILQSISNIGLVYTLFIGSSITKARQCKQSPMRLKTISNKIKNNLQWD